MHVRSNYINICLWIFSGSVTNQGRYKTNSFYSSRRFAEWRYNHSKHFNISIHIYRNRYFTGKRVVSANSMKEFAWNLVKVSQYAQKEETQESDSYYQKIFEKVSLTFVIYCDCFTGELLVSSYGRQHVLSIIRQVCCKTSTASERWDKLRRNFRLVAILIRKHQIRRLQQLKKEVF